MTGSPAPVDPRPRGVSAGAVAALALAFLACAAFHLAAWRGVPIHEPDTAGYLEIARDLADDGRLSQLYARTAGYPLFLLAMGAAEAPGLGLVAAQLALHFFAVSVLAALLVRLGAGRAAVVVFVVVALLPPFVEHAAYVLTESVVQALVVGGVAGLAAWLVGGGAGWLALASVGLAAAPLVHPGYVLAGPALLVLALLASATPLAPPGLARRALIAAAPVLVALALLVGGAVAHNQARFGYAGLSPYLGVTLSHKTSRVIDRLPPDAQGVREILIRHRDAALVQPGGDHLGYSYVFRAMPELEQATGLRGPALDRLLVRMNLGLIARSPLEYVDEIGRSMIWYWGPGIADVSAFGSRAVKLAWHGLRASVVGAFFATLALLAGPLLLLATDARATSPKGLDSAARGRLVAAAVVAGAVLYSAAVSTTVTSAVWRLRVPVDLCILSVAVLGPRMWRDARRALRASDS